MRTLVFSLRLKDIKEVESPRGREDRDTLDKNLGVLTNIRSIDVAQYLTLLGNWLCCIIRPTRIVSE